MKKKILIIDMIQRIFNGLHQCNGQQNDVGGNRAPDVVKCPSFWFMKSRKKV